MGSQKTKFQGSIPLLFELGINTNIDFILFNFHDFFNGVLGLNDLMKLNLNIDLVNKKLIGPNLEIPFKFRQHTEVDFCFSVNPQEKTVKMLPVSIFEGEIITKPGRISELYIPQILSVSENGFALIEIQNPTDNTVTINLDEPLPVDPFDGNQFEIFTMDHLHNPNINKSQTKKSKISPLLRTDHLNSQEKILLNKLCNDYSDIFLKPGDKLTFTSKVKHEIKTSDNVPVHTKSYRFPYVHKEEVQRQINEMLEKGIIRPSCSPWSSPIWIVPKKTDASGKVKWRIVCDYRNINSKTIDDRYPIPNINDILDRLGRAQYFSTLDLASGFHQIEIEEKSIEKTAFNVNNGHYEYLRMPFGLKNAPSTFQRVMDEILKDLQNKICMVYMDDIIIFSTGLQEHIQNLKLVFSKLREANLKIQIDKCEFLRKEVEFLGHVVTSKGIRPNSKKIEAIQKFKIPKTQREIKSFLGLLGYYRKFIKNFAKITKPMTKCLKKNEKIEHTKEFIDCFNTCKNILTSEPVLAYPDFKKPFELTTDASNYAIGAILSQDNHPICYASRTLNPAEVNYSTIEKELLAIVWSCKYFRPYLFGHKFTILTDHKPLQWLFSLKEPNSRLVRWRLKLEEFDYTIQYKKGKLNQAADALSRNPVDLNPIETESTYNNPGDVDTIIEEFIRKEQEMPTISTEEINDIFQPQLKQNIPKINTISDISIIPIKSQPNQYIIVDNIKNTSFKPKNFSDFTVTKISNQSNQSNLKPQNHDNQTSGPDITIIPLTEQSEEKLPSTSETVHTSIEEPILNIPISEKLLNTFKNQIFITSGDIEDIQCKREKIFENTRLYVSVSSKDPVPHFIKLLKEYINAKQTYAIYFRNELIAKNFIVTVQNLFKDSSFKFIQCSKVLEDILTDENQQEKLNLYHTTKTCHRGINEMKTALSSKFYWPKMIIDIENFVNNCEICLKNKYDRNPPIIKFNLTPTSSKPFEHVHIDTFKISNESYLTIIDTFSRYGQAYPLNSVTGISIIENLLNFVSHHGLPLKITTDSGTEFKNKEFEDFCKLYKIELHYTTPKNSNSNSPVERFHSTLIEHFRCLQEQHKKLTADQLIKRAILGYNNSVHSVTKYTPFEIIKGHINNTNPFDLSDHVIISNYVQSHKENTKELYRQIQEQNEKTKGKIIAKLNENRQEPPNFENQNVAYIKTKARNKNLPKFKQVPITDQSNIKIFTKKGMYHKSIARKPRTKQKSVLQVNQDASSSAPNPCIPGPSKPNLP